MLRLFIAIQLKKTIIEQLHNICFGVRTARWLSSDQIHLTLRFIGKCDEGQYYSILDALQDIAIPTFTLNIQGVGYFPPRGNPRILWAGIQHSTEICALRKAIDVSLKRIGIPEEGKKFHPHITLARLKDHTPPKMIIPFLTQNSLFKCDSFNVTQFHLYSSILRTEGAQHRIEESYNLLQSS